MKTIKLIFLFAPFFMAAQTYVGASIGNEGAYSAAVTYQPTLFGARVQYFDRGGEPAAWQLQTTIEPYRGPVYTPVVSLGYNFQGKTTQPMVGLQNQVRVVPSVYVTGGYEAIFEYKSPVMQYIYLGTVIKVMESTSKVEPRRFY